MINRHRHRTTIMCTRNGKVSIVLRSRLLHKFHRVNRLLALALHVWTGPYGTYVWPGNCMQISPYSPWLSMKRPPKMKALLRLNECPFYVLTMHEHTVDCKQYSILTFQGRRSRNYTICHLCLVSYHQLCIPIVNTLSLVFQALKEVLVVAVLFGARWQEVGLSHKIPIACVGCGQADMVTNWLNVNVKYFPNP